MLLLLVHARVKFRELPPRNSKSTLHGLCFGMSWPENATRPRVEILENRHRLLQVGPGRIVNSTQTVGKV